MSDTDKGRLESSLRTDDNFLSPPLQDAHLRLLCGVRGYVSPFGPPKGAPWRESCLFCSAVCPVPTCLRRGARRSWCLGGRHHGSTGTSSLPVTLGARRSTVASCLCLCGHSWRTGWALLSCGEMACSVSGLSRRRVWWGAEPLLGADL